MRLTDRVYEKIDKERERENDRQNKKKQNITFEDRDVFFSLNGVLIVLIKETNQRKSI